MVRYSAVANLNSPGDVRTIGGRQATAVIDRKRIAIDDGRTEVDFSTFGRQARNTVRSTVPATGVAPSQASRTPVMSGR